MTAARIHPHLGTRIEVPMAKRPTALETPLLLRPEVVDGGAVVVTVKLERAELAELRTEEREEREELNPVGSETVVDNEDEPEGNELEGSDPLKPEVAG